MSEHSFAAATAMQRVAAGHHSGIIAPGWDIAGNANGGYLMALAARAMAGHADRPDPVTLTAHYLRPVQPGPVTLHCETVKTGKAFATVRADLARNDTPLLTLLGAFGTLDGSAADALRVEATPPELPPVAECIPVQPGNGFDHPFHRNVDLRLHPEDAGFVRGMPSGQARMRGWFQLPGAVPMDTFALLLGLDAFPPTIFNARLPVGWTPTVELTAHVRARPAPGCLRARFTTRFVTGGFLEEDGELWDANDRLVAQSRQLALVPRQAG